MACFVRNGRPPTPVDPGRRIVIVDGVREVLVDEDLRRSVSVEFREPQYGWFKLRVLIHPHLQVSLNETPDIDDRLLDRRDEL
jgi:hypothetical protein